MISEKATLIRRLHVQNFMSLKDVTIDFSPLTIFIGPNASGKSAVFKALMALSMLLGRTPVRGPHGEFNLEPAVTLDHLVWQGNSGLPIVFQAWLSDDPDDSPGYTLELMKEARGWSVTHERIWLGDKWFDSKEGAFSYPTERMEQRIWSFPNRATLSHLLRPFANDQMAAPIINPLLDLKERIGYTFRYRVSANDIASFVNPQELRGPEQIYIRDNGRGLSLELQRLQGINRPLFETIERELHEIFPHIRFINPHSERIGVGLTFTTERSEDPVPASQESDGVLISTFLLWRLHTAAPNLRICLEEPENGVHPYLLGERYRLIRRFSLGEGDRISRQILVATHSPDFISAIEDRKELQETVRVVEFDKEKGTIIHKLSHFDQIETLLDAFNNNLGELWWSGAIGAVPSS